MLRTKRTFAVPKVGIGPSVAVALAVLVVVGLAVLAVIDVPPPSKTIETPIPAERFSR